MTQFADKMARMQEEISRMKAQLVEDVKNELAPAAKEFFDKYPFVRGIAWTQYTPYFNDGEACEFGVHGAHVFTFHDFPLEEYPDLNILSVYDGVEAYVLGANYTGRYKPDWTSDEFTKDFTAFMSFKDDAETMETIFGDHVAVWITPEGVQVDEYEHD